MRLLTFALWRSLEWVFFGATVAWVLYRWIATSRDTPFRLVSKWIASGIIIYFVARNLGPGLPGAGYGAFLLVPLLAVCGLLLAIIWAPNIANFFAKPFGSLYDGGNAEVEARPVYSIATARRKQGKFREAEAEIRKQLAHFPEDFEGQMLLAELQAEEFKDVDSATLTIEEILNQEGHNIRNLAYALNRLADWHLKLTGSREEAIAALEQIARQWPDHQVALLAKQRLAHLTPASMLDDQKDRRRLRLVSHPEYIGLQGQTASPAPQENPGEKAVQLVEHLNLHPDDSEAREELALLYASHYQRLDLAIEQLDQLVRQPHQPARQVVHWLQEITDLYVKQADDLESAKKTLERIIQRYPKSAAAENARHRIAYLQLERRRHSEGRTLRLGTYKQNLGLNRKKDL